MSHHTRTMLRTAETLVTPATACARSALASALEAGAPIAAASAANARTARTLPFPLYTALG